MPDHTYTTDHEREAFQMGAAAGLAAASWVADGNTSDEHITRVLAMMDDGDPQVESYLPVMPNLSGEWADAQTPVTLAGEILGDTSDDLGELREDPSVVDAIADAWEAGVFSTFEHECERILRAMAPDPEPEGLEDVLRAYVACAIWSSHDESTPEGGEPMDRNYGPEDIAPVTLASMREDASAFLSDPDLADALAFWRAELGAEQIGHDFWLTRNGHGAGFWDRFTADPGARFGRVLTDAAKVYGTVDLYVGDDGLIYS